MSSKPVVKLGHLKITDHLILGVTLDKLERGLENLAPVDLQTQAYRGWNQLAEDLRAGALDGAFILAPLAMELYHAGAPIKLILQGHKSGSTLIKSKRANIRSLQDFRGKALLIPHYLSAHHLLFDKLLRDNGLEVGAGKDIIFDVVAPSDIPEIIEWDEKGTVGGFIVAEPFGSQVVAAGYGEEFALSKDIWPRHPCCVLVVKQSLIEAHPEAVQALTDSLVRSGRYIEEHRCNGVCAIGARFLDQDEAVVRHVLTEPADRVTMDELFPVIEDLDYMQTYMTTKIQAMSARIDLRQFVDTRFAERAGAK